MNKVIRSKFKVESILKEEHGDTLKACPVYSSEEGHPNKTWWQYTPSGSLVIQAARKGVFDHLKPGDELYLDAIPVNSAED